MSTGTEVILKHSWVVSKQNRITGFICLFWDMPHIYWHYTQGSLLAMLEGLHVLSGIQLGSTVWLKSNVYHIVLVRFDTFNCTYRTYWPNKNTLCGL